MNTATEHSASLAHMVMGRFYRDAGTDPTQLPWHRDAPSDVLGTVVNTLPAGSTALDIGCGAGVLSLWLARRGMKVTGIDLFPEAIAMAESAAAADGRAIDADFLVGDLLDFRGPAGFDLVYDSGCLHSLVGGDAARYKEAVLGCLAPEGIFVLEHWGKRHPLDWRPIGPRRRSLRAIVDLFSPELELIGLDEDDFQAPLPFGPTVRGAAYAFRRRSRGILSPLSN